METSTRDRTGLLVLDPYNDFPREGGTRWPFANEVAESVDLWMGRRCPVEELKQSSRLGAGRRPEVVKIQ